MIARIKQYLLIGAVVGAFFFLLSHHFIFTSLTTFDVLKKKELTLKYTFYSLEQASAEDALRINDLRDDGLGDLMVAKGILTQEELDRILLKIDQ